MILWHAISLPPSAVADINGQQGLKPASHHIHVTALVEMPTSERFFAAGQ